MDEVENTPLEKRNKEEQIRTTLRLEMVVQNMGFAKWKHLDETPVRRGMIDTTLWLKQDREGIRMI